MDSETYPKDGKNGNCYVLMSGSDLEAGEPRSYLFSYDNNGNKIWEQVVEKTSLFDFAISENANIYANGKTQEENVFMTTSMKYAQCAATANLKSMEHNDKTESANLESFVKLYPNPNDGSMQLEYDFADNQPGIFEMYDFTGRMVYSMQLTQSKGKANISALYLSRGVYMYRLTSGELSLGKGKVVIIK
jgi:hypothetical protein